MALIDSTILNLELVIIASIGSIIFGIACKKQPELRKWLYVFILSTLGIFINYLTFLSKILEYISFSCYAITIIYSTYLIVKEYMFFYGKQKYQNIVNGIIFYENILAISAMAVSAIVLLIDLVLLIRITIKKKSFTYYFFCLVMMGAFLTIFGNIFINLNIPIAIDINVGIDIFFTSTLVLTGIVAIFEDKIRESEMKYQESFNRESFYKDLVSHDINNILQNIKSSSELINLYLKEKPEDVKDLTKIIDNQINRGVKLVRNVRSLSNVERLADSLIETDLMLTLNQIVELLNKDTQEKQVNIILNSDYEIVKIKANDLLADVFENIIGNAIKHNDKNKVEILIQIKKIDSYFRLEFIDNGQGIPNDLKEKIFLSYSKLNLKGMGIGLSLVKKIVDSYNGNIWVEDRVKEDHSKGSIFIITLPSSD